MIVLRDSYTTGCGISSLVAGEGKEVAECCSNSSYSIDAKCIPDSVYDPDSGTPGRFPIKPR